MAKARKQKKRNKPVPRMTSKDVEKLGKYSNKHTSFANQLAIYCAPPKKELPKLNPNQERALACLKANLAKRLEEKQLC